VYKNILIAYDGSADGRAALAEGVELALACKAQVAIVAVIDINLDVAAAEAYASGTADEAQLAETKTLLEAEVARLRQFGLAATAVVDYGRPADQIAEKARELGADLVVIGHRAHGLWARWANEPVGANLLKHLPCSLLVVPQKR
jgi:nucleotide-binding universal stress UspA family protein